MGYELAAIENGESIEVSSANSSGLRGVAGNDKTEVGAQGNCHSTKIDKSGPYAVIKAARKRAAPPACLRPAGRACGLGAGPGPRRAGSGTQACPGTCDPWSDATQRHSTGNSPLRR